MRPSRSTRATPLSSAASSSSAAPSLSNLSPAAVADVVEPSLQHDELHPIQDEESTISSASSSMPSSATVPSASTSVPNDVLLNLLTQLAMHPSSSQGTIPSSHSSVFGSDPAISVRSPDPFKGTDRSKLRSFLAQCRMAFAANPRKFVSEKSKIMFAASYFTSVALAWFEPFLFLEPEEAPSFLSSFSSFEEELMKTFGDPDSEATAEHKLNSIKMKEDHQVSRYITDFRKYQLQVRWDERALMFSFRKGLPPRILDELARLEEKPRNLNDLQQASLKIDIRYWERQQERKEFGQQERLPQQHKDARHHSKSYSNPLSKATPLRITSTPSSSSSLSSFPSSSHSPAISKDKRDRKYPYLDTKGKLTEEEKERRKKNSLCMYCGAANHSQTDCPNKKNNSKLKHQASIKAATIATATAKSTAISSSSHSDVDEPVTPTVCATFTIANPQAKN